MKLTKEIMVSASPDGMQDPLSSPLQDGSPVTTPARKGHAFPQGLEDPQVDCVEAERQVLQDRGFSEAAIKKALTATRDSSR